MIELSKGQHWFLCSECQSLPFSSVALRGPCVKCSKRTAEIDQTYGSEFFRKLNSGGIVPSDLKPFKDTKDETNA